MEKVGISPYFLGVLLGDGGIKNAINVTTPEMEIYHALQEEAEFYGMTMRSIPAGKADTYFFLSGKPGYKGSRLHQELKALGLRRLGSGSKHVPHSYKTLPEVYRYEIIAGLLDTDGSLSGAGYDEALIRRDLTETKKICESFGCPLEIILKDISTVSYQPERLWRWAEIAMEVVS